VTDTSHDVGAYEPIAAQPAPAGAAPGIVRTAPVDLMRPDVNVQRIMWTGTIWFAAAVGASAVFLGMLLSSGWRPTVLSLGMRAVWWFGSGFVALSLGLIGWSGCPVLEGDVPTANRNKSRTMQLGTMMFIVGSALAVFSVLVGPPT
jgi:hypothetical protein